MIEQIECDELSYMQQAPVDRYKFVYYIMFNPANTKEAIWPFSFFSRNILPGSGRNCKTRGVELACVYLRNLIFPWL